MKWIFFDLLTSYIKVNNFDILIEVMYRILIIYYNLSLDFLK